MRELGTGIGECVGVSSDDAALVRESIADPTQFEAIFEHHHAGVWSYLARGAGRGRADDLAGQVFVVAFQRRASFDPAVGDVRPWLLGIARNLLKGGLRSEARGQRAIARLVNRGHVLADESQDVVDADATSSATAAAIAAMRRLPDGERELLELAVWEQLSYGEIATMLDLPIGTVKSRLSRIRQRLRELVEASDQELRIETDEETLS